MNFHVGGGCSSNGRLSDLWLNKILLLVFFFTLWSKVHAYTVEWSLVSPYQLSQSKNNWYAPQGGDSANIDLSKGGQVAFVPASMMGYGLYNRPYSPREINLYLSKPKHSRDSSSEEHHRKKKHHRRDSSEEKPHYEPEHHREHRPEHHKSAKEELNDEHAEQAEISAGIAGELTKLSGFMRSQVKNHIELRDRELNQGNVDAAKKEQIIIDMYQDQIKYLEGIEKAQEAIMAGEVEMFYDKDGADQKHGHHGHHGHGSDHGGHGNHHGGDQHHGAHQPTHHHEDNDEDEHEEHHGHDPDDEGEDEEHGYDGGDDDDEGYGNGHDGDDEDENEGHGGHHQEGPQGHHQGDDEEGHHEKNDDDDGFYDANQELEDNNDPDYEPGEKHKLDKRSPFISSYLPSLSGSDTTTSLKTPDTAAIDTAAKPNTGLVTSPDPSSATTYSNDAPATVDATATTNPSTPTTPVVTPANANDNSGWLSMLGLSNDAPVYSPYALLKYMKPSDTSSDNLMSMFNVFSDPSNSSYLSNASTLMRVVMFFMPGTGIVDQVYFTMALSKIMWEAATMYYEGYGNTEIAVVVLGELVEAAYLSRRGEDSIIGQKILTPGDNIKIDGMDVPAFLKYIKNMKYPDLTETQEAKLQKDLDNLITITYPNISPELKPTFTGGLKDTLKFLSLFNIQGDLHVENVDVNFSEVYIRMHSAFDDSPLEKIKKTILGAIDAIKSNFN